MKLGEATKFCKNKMKNFDKKTSNCRKSMINITAS